MSRRRELRKTKYFTVLSVFMLCLSIGLAIPCVIEGINIARNVYSFELNDEEISPGNFIHANFNLKESQRINIDIRSGYEGGVWYLNPAKVIISIMNESNFTDWIADGSPIPAILNSTIYFNSSELSVNNLIVPRYNTSYIVIYNANAAAIEVDVDFTILPWGHILTISIVGFLLVMSLSIMTIKFVAAAYFNSEDYIKEKLKKNKTATTTDENKTVKIHEETGERFCVSCGAPLTPKDGQYCPNCGASLGN